MPACAAGFRRAVQSRETFQSVPRSQVVSVMVRRKFALWIAAVLATSLVAESACHAALASQLGRKRYTARLASNKALRKQQLIVDPEGILGGSASVLYDTRVVRLVGVMDPGDFEVTAGLVGVVPSTGGLSTTLLDLNAFLASGGGALPDPDPRNLAVDEPQYREQGYVQIFFDRRDSILPGDVSALAAEKSASVIPNLPGYATVAEDGETGINDTHALMFEYLPGVPDDFRAAYRIFATPPRAQTVPDSLTLADDPENPVPYTELGSAAVVGGLAGFDVRPEPMPVPIPPAALIGGVGLGLLAGRRWLRRRAVLLGKIYLYNWTDHD